MAVPTARDDGQPMIATAALAGSSLLAEVSFSRSDRRKMASSVLDDGDDCNARRQQLARKSWLALRARISDAKSAALLDPLCAK